jgi:hypothetical protein
MCRNDRLMECVVYKKVKSQFTIMCKALPYNFGLFFCENSHSGAEWMVRT